MADRTLTAGTNITLDESVAGQLIINATGGASSYPGYDVDTRPDTPHAQDREFDSSADLSALTWDNQGTSTATVQVGALVIKPQTNGGVAHSKRSLWEAVPANSFTFTAEVNLENGRTYANQAGITLRNSSGDKRLIFAVFMNSSAVAYVIVSRMTGATTNSGDVYSAPSPGFCRGVLRFVYNHTSGLVSCFYSITGQAFGDAIFSENISAFLGAPTHAGYFADSLSASGCIASFPFGRFQNTAAPDDYEGGLRILAGA